MTKHPDPILERLHLHWITGTLLTERSKLMPSTLRDDLMHPARVAHASMHQFARNATDAGQDQLADEALQVAKQINALIEGQSAKPTARPRPANVLRPPTQDAV